MNNNVCQAHFVPGTLCVRHIFTQELLIPDSPIIRYKVTASEETSAPPDAHVEPEADKKGLGIIELHGKFKFNEFQTRRTLVRTEFLKE